MTTRHRWLRERDGRCDEQEDVGYGRAADEAQQHRLSQLNAGSAANDTLLARQLRTSKMEGQFKRVLIRHSAAHHFISKEEHARLACKPRAICYRTLSGPASQPLLIA